MFELNIVIDTNEEQDNYELLKMFKIMCAYSGCSYSEYKIKDNILLKEKVREVIKKARYPTQWADDIDSFKERLCKELGL